MSSSSKVIRPMPLRTSVGAIWEMIPPAPMHNTLDAENTCWSKPGILFCRSSAPGIAFPTSLIEVGESVNAGRIVFHSVDFYFKILIQPDEPHEAIAAENDHD